MVTHSGGVMTHREEIVTHSGVILTNSGGVVTHSGRMVMVMVTVFKPSGARKGSGSSFP